MPGKFLDFGSLFPTHGSARWSSTGLGHQQPLKAVCKRLHTGVRLLLRLHVFGARCTRLLQLFPLLPGLKANAKAKLSETAGRNLVAADCCRDGLAEEAGPALPRLAYCQGRMREADHGKR